MSWSQLRSAAFVVKDRTLRGQVKLDYILELDDREALAHRSKRKNERRTENSEKPTGTPTSLNCGHSSKKQTGHV